MSKKNIKTMFDPLPGDDLSSEETKTRIKSKPKKRKIKEKPKPRKKVTAKKKTIKKETSKNSIKIEKPIVEEVTQLVYKDEMREKLSNAIVPYKDYPIEGVTYFDLNPIYKDRMLKSMITNTAADLIRNLIIGPANQQFIAMFDYIAVIESRGFIIGAAIADNLHKGLLLLRSKPGRLPGKTAKVEHNLEYGNSQMEVQTGVGKVLIFDDVLATGGTANAAVKVLKKAGYSPLRAMFLLELTYCKPSLDVEYNSILSYEKK